MEIWIHIHEFPFLPYTFFTYFYISSLWRRCKLVAFWTSSNLLVCSCLCIIIFMRLLTAACFCGCCCCCFFSYHSVVNGITRACVWVCLFHSKLQVFFLGVLICFFHYYEVAIITPKKTHVSFHFHYFINVRKCHAWPLNNMLMGLYTTSHPTSSSFSSSCPTSIDKRIFGFCSL